MRSLFPPNYAQNGSFASLAASWLACSSTTEPLNSRSVETNPGAQLERELRAFVRRQEGEGITPLECPIEWARESNAFDCVSVLQTSRVLE